LLKIKRTDLVLREAVAEICINRYGVDHDCELRNAPPHDKGTSPQMLLKGSAENHESAYVQWYSEIT
jgi:hypothetical protein